MTDNAETRRNDSGTVSASCDLSCSKSSTPALHSDEMREAAWNALFEPRESDAIDNLDGALIDIRRMSEMGKPTDAVCIRTIERVLVQLGKAHAALSTPQTPWRGIRDDVQQNIAESRHKPEQETPRLSDPDEDYVRIRRGDPKEISEIIQPYRKFINDTPMLQSLLYDIDMLPEQCVTIPGAIRLMAFCEVWKKGAAGELSTNASVQSDGSLCDEPLSEQSFRDIRRETIEECAKVADAAAKSMTRLGKVHPENSPNRDRCFARAREAIAIAVGIRSMFPTPPALIGDGDQK